MEEAQKEADKFNKVNEENRAGYVLRAYHCGDCNKYHLTSKTERTGTRKKNNPTGLTKQAEYHFIKNETAFWEKRFKVNETIRKNKRNGKL